MFCLFPRRRYIALIGTQAQDVVGRLNHHVNEEERLGKKQGVLGNLFFLRSEIQPIVSVFLIRFSGVSSEHSVMMGVDSGFSSLSVTCEPGGAELNISREFSYSVLA